MTILYITGILAFVGALVYSMYNILHNFSNNEV